MLGESPIGSDTKKSFPNMETRFCEFKTPPGGKKNKKGGFKLG